MNEAQETGDKVAMPDWLAAQSFESASDAIPLDRMMNNDEMAERGIGEGIWMRTCAVILQDDDKQLYEKFKDDESAKSWMDWTDELGNFIESQKAGLQILEACRMRLFVCLSRYAESIDGGAK